jgi:hypothetical protein
VMGRQTSIFCLIRGFAAVTQPVTACKAIVSQDSTANSTEAVRSDALVPS